MRRIISFVLIFGACLPLFALEGKTIREALPVDFSLLNDPAPRKEKNIRYLPVQQSLQKRTVRETLDNTITLSTQKPWERIGRIDVSINPSIKLPNGAGLRVYTFDPISQEYSLVAESAIPEQSNFSVDFAAQRASQVHVEFTGVQLDDSAVTMQAFAVQLSSKKRVMLMGDSVTDGKFADDWHGYRHMLYDRLTADGYTVDFVGDFGDPPYEAHYQGGKKIDDFYPTALGGRGRTDCTQGMHNYQPNIVAIHLGTNDISSETGTPISPYGEGANFAGTQAGQMATLLNYLLRWHNGRYSSELEKIIVSMIIPIKYADSTIIEFNAAVAELVRDFQKGVITGQPEPIFIADNFSRIREYPGLVARHYNDLYADNLHPNNYGHIQLTNSYYSAFKRIVYNDVDWFTEMAFPAGVAGFDHHFEHQGVAVADVNMDGRDDLYITRTDWRNKQAQDDLFISHPDLYFERQTNERQIADAGASRGCVFLDADNDGDMDLFNGNSEAQNRLYENVNGDYFTDMTDQANIANYLRVTTGTIAFDANNDGQTDIYAINSREPNEMYLKRGINQFELTDNGANDITEENIPSLSGIAVDYDNDNDQDIYIVKRDAANVLFKNDGTGHFSKLASSPILTTTRDNGAFWADLNNNGLLDLIITSSDDNLGQLQFFENLGNGQFTPRNDISIDMYGYSVLVGDFNNDGWQDIITTNEVVAGAMYLNRGNFNFEQQQETAAKVVGGDVRGAATLDFDADGDLDFFCARADMLNTFHINNLDNNNHYLQIHVQGSYAAVHYGAKIWLYENGYLGDADKLLAFRQVLSANGHISQSSPTQHFGLGTIQSCDVLVRFTTGEWVTIHNQNADQRITISPEGTTQSTLAEQLALIAGDGQTQTVGTTLESALQVQALDNSNAPVAGTSVTWMVNSGDATILESGASGDALALEAELGITNGAAIIVNDPSAGANAFFTADFSNPGYAESKLSFTLDKAGDYFAWVRLEKIDSNPVIYYTLDGQDRSLALQTTLGWEWHRLDTNAFQLAQGNHIITLQSAQSSLRIDKVLFTRDAYFTPQGRQESNDDELLTDSQGISSRTIQLGSTAGDIRITAILNSKPLEKIEFQLTSTPGPAAVLHKSGGDQQTGEPDEPLADLFILSVSDVFNNPISEESILFTVENGNGSLSITNTVTDNTGRAFTRFTPGSTSSLQKVKAEIPNSAIPPVYFETFVKGTADELVYLSGGNQTGTVMQPLSNPILVKVLEEDKTAAIGYQVSARTTSPDGVISTNLNFASADSIAHAQTNSEGIAQFYWQLGKTAGNQHIIIDAGALTNSPLYLSASAQADEPFMLIKTNGDQQTGIVGQNLKTPLGVRLVDAFGNSIPQYPITFSAISSAGTINGEPSNIVQTNDDGEAQVNFTLGTTAGFRQIASAQASKNGTLVNGSPVNFSATAFADTAYYARIMGGNNQSGQINESLPKDLSVMIWDKYNNIVSAHNVEFGLKSGDGHFNGATSVISQTDAQGLASVSFTFGQRSGQVTIYAYPAAVNQDTLFFVLESRPGDAFALNYLSGNNQTGAMHKPLPEALRVAVVDEFSNGIANVPVIFTNLAGDAHFDNQQTTTVLTDSNGIAAATLTLGSMIGDSIYHVQAAAEFENHILQNSPIDFYASVQLGFPSQLVAQTRTTNLVGTANQSLRDAIVVKVMDKDEQAIPGLDVRFRVSAGGGKIIESDKSEMWVTTDSDGLAQVHWQLGAADFPQQLLVTADYAGNPLSGSPLLFQADAITTTGTKLVKISGDNQYTQPAAQTRDPLVVQVNDQYDYPVSGHPVIFEIQDDGAFAENNQNFLLTFSDAKGQCTPFAILGEQHNNYTVHVKSFNNKGSDLQGSPLTFSLFADSDIPNMDFSWMTATSPAPINPGAYAGIRVYAIDDNHSPISGRQIELTSDNANCTITPATGFTDADGYFYAKASMTTAGTAIIQARDIRAEKNIGETVSINFIAMQPQFLLAMPGDYNLHPNSALSEPIRVHLLDNNGQALANYPVEFSVQDSIIAIKGANFAHTDSLGFASCMIIGKSEIGQTQLMASIPGTDLTPISFPVQVLPIDNLVLETLSGNNQQAQVTEKLPEPLQVLAHDLDGRPIGHLQISFSVQDGQHARVDSTIVFTDAYGMAQTRLHLQTTAGSGIVIAQSQEFQAHTTFIYTVLAGNPEKLHPVLSLDSLQVAQQSAPLLFKAHDRYQNTVHQAEVNYALLQGDGNLVGDLTQYSDTNGLVGAELIYHAPNFIEKAKIQATLANNAQAEIMLHVLPGKPFKLEIIQGDGQHGIAGHVLNQPIQAVVADSFDNRIPSQLVTFQADSDCGEFQPQKIKTDTTGIAQTEWFLGNKSLTQTAKVFAEGVINSPVHLSALVTENNAPLFSNPTEFTVNENDTLTFSVTAIDAEGDSIDIFANVLPEGAQFDTSTSQFEWVPGFSQAGTHFAIFTAQDITGKSTITSVQILVKNTNRVPIIQTDTCIPLSRQLGTLTQPGFIDFFVSAVDPDGNTLFYQWFVNDSLCATEARFRMQSQVFGSGEKQITAIVHDMQDTVSTSWELSIITRVELSYFGGTSQPYIGNVLEWQTRREFDNVGFYVMRSSSSTGEFSSIGFVESNIKGNYTFTDSDVLPDELFFYKIRDLEKNGETFDHQSIMISPAVPEEFALHANFPNPFNPATTLHFDIPEKSHVQIQIYNLLGQMVTEIVNKELKPGFYKIQWDAQQYASGSYLIVMNSPKGKFIQKALLLK